MNLKYTIVDESIIFKCEISYSHEGEYYDDDYDYDSLLGYIAVYSR
jgi:hypothetical protein